jgi:hypothetical protein
MIIFAVLLAFGAGFMVRQLVDRDQGWSYREFTMDPWARHCGFYPGSKPGSTAATFDEACTDFEYAWLVFLSKQTEADFQASRSPRVKQRAGDGPLHDSIACPAALYCLGWIDKLS